jgi:hypothetical protein
MKVTLFLVSIAVLCFSAAPAIAAAGGPPGADLQQVLDNITTDPAGDSSVDVTSDYVPDVTTDPVNGDSYWSITATGGSTSTVIIELAAFAADNKMGVFDLSDPTKTVELFDGSAGQGSQVVMTIKNDGSVFLNITNDTGVDFAGNGFGFYLDSTDNSGGGFWYSETSMNSDGYDHMYAYAGKNDTVQLPGLAAGPWTPGEYVLAIEDLAG